MAPRHTNNWDNRYDEDRFFYGEEPNYFVAQELKKIPTGRGLFLAEGEGRNAVFAAGLGHEVVAVDSSVVGRRKALELAAHAGVTLEYRCEDLLDGHWAREEWDFVVLCFAHLPPEAMAAVHGRVASCLNPGGSLILLSFSKHQFGRHSGGPPRLEWLHEAESLRKQFPGVAWSHLQEKEVDLRESVGHFGMAWVIEGLGVSGPSDQF